MAQARWDMSIGARNAGVDPVSVQLPSNMHEMHDRATAYVCTWAEQVRQTRDALQAQLDGYVATEQGNAKRLG